MMGELLKLLAVCVVAAMLCVFLKNTAPFFTVLISIFVSASVAFYCISAFLPYIEFFAEITQNTQFSSYAKVLFKVCCVGILTRLSSELCKDAGETALASKALLAGKTAILMLSLPVIKTLFEQIKELLF